MFKIRCFVRMIKHILLWWYREALKARATAMMVFVYAVYLFWNSNSRIFDFPFLFVTSFWYFYFCIFFYVPFIKFISSWYCKMYEEYLRTFSGWGGAVDYWLASLSGSSGSGGDVVLCSWAWLALNAHSASLHPDVSMGTSEFNAGVTLRWTSIPFRKE